MKRETVKYFALIWAVMLSLTLAPAGANAQQGGNDIPAQTGVFSFSPCSPADFAAALAGLSQQTNSAEQNSREYMKLWMPLGLEYLRENCGMGSEGVVDAGCFIMPFGTMGERVALAFCTGEYVPPEEEKLQPMLAKLAQVRTARFIAQEVGSRVTVYALILLNDRLDEGLETWLQQRGVELFGFYPYAAYRARVPVDVLHEIAAHPQVRWVGQPYPLQKLDPGLHYFLGDTTGEVVGVCVSLFGPDDEVRELIQVMAVETLFYDSSSNILCILVDAATLNMLLDMDAVLFVEMVRPVRLAGLESQPSISADLLWARGYDGRPQGGRSVRVGIIDSGVNLQHVDFTSIRDGTSGFNRAGADPSDWRGDPVGHGTLVAGVMVGEGRANRRFRGTAPGFRDTDAVGFDLLISRIPVGAPAAAQLIATYLALGDMRGVQSDGTINLNQRRQVVNLSWGILIDVLPGITSGTDLLSILVDTMFQENILCVAAAGNEGAGGAIRPPGTAKGALTVGAVFDDGSLLTDRVTEYSSRGPTGDGRVKPDVVAPGSWVVSCSHVDNNGYVGDDPGEVLPFGTSLAAPHVTGLAITYLARYEQPAWAVKADMIANAIDLKQDRSAQGWGKVDGMLLHYGMDGFSRCWWSRNRRTGSLSEVSFNLPRDASLLRVVLVYPDPPASHGAAQALVNNLDLYLDRAPFSTGPTGEWSSISQRDNVEVIEVTDARAGDYQIKIHTYSQNQGDFQNWAVSIRVVYGSLRPNLTIGFGIDPPFVKLGERFTALAIVDASSYVASGVYGFLDPLSAGVVVDSMTVLRYGPNGIEAEELPRRHGINMGNIHIGHPRAVSWSLRGVTEGTKSFLFTAESINAASRSVVQTVVVDGTPPTNWQDFSPSQWTNDPTPDCRIRVQDVLAGLNTGALQYWYRTGGVQHGPFSCSTSAANGSTALEWIWANDVPFHREGGSGENQIFFRAHDRAGNYSDSGWITVKIDWTPPQDWQNFTVLGGGSSGLTPTCSVQVRDVLSGLRVSSGRYRYSTNGGSTWSSWLSASVTGSDGTRAFETVTAINVPFNQRSSSLNKIQFEIQDLAGNRATSPIYNVDTARSATSLDLENAEGLVGQQVTLRATLRRTTDNTLLAGKTVSFIVDGEAVGSAVTNSAGVATLLWNVSDGQLGHRPMSAQFAGDSEHLPARDDATFRRYATTHLIVHDAEAHAGDTITLGATLLRGDNYAPVQGRTLHFALAGRAIGSATTNSSGDALIDFTIPADTPPGGYIISVTFDGDEAYNSSYGEGWLRVHEPLPEIETVIEVFGAVGMQGEPTTLAARLSRLVGGDPIPNRWLHFFVDGWYVGSERTDSGGYAAVSFLVPLDLPPGEHLVEVYFDGDSRYYPSSGYGFLFVYPRPASVSGVVHLGDYVGDVTAHPVLFEIRYPDSTEPVQVIELFLDSEGRYYFESWRHQGVYDVTAKASHWLRQKHRRVSLWGDVTLDFYLINGDIDHDNEVTLFDFGQLVAAFGSVPGDDNWNHDADLDGDLEVTLFDFGIIVRNFGLVGDE